MLLQNESTVDRALRVLLGVILVSLFFVGPQTPWALLGLIPLATGLIGFCPLYRVLGLSTCKVPTPVAAARCAECER
jgi:Inner membrane protein YgaP-like, transmembrane domain